MLLRALSAILLLAACGASHGVDGGTADAGATTSCDPSTVLCDALPPPCPAGFTNSVEGTCWGPCVMNAECAPIACDPEGGGWPCPEGWGCVSEGECRPPR